jgi:hypothetical protein
MFHQRTIPSKTTMSKVPKTPNQIGDDAEDRVQAILGGERIKQSGGGSFWKLDVRGGTFVWSVKATKGSRRIHVTAALFREAYRAARGVVGAGDGVRSGIITDEDGELIAHIPLQDLADLLTGEIEPYIQPSKARSRRLRARG